MGGGGHGHHHHVPEPEYMKHLAPKSGLCPPEFHYTRGMSAKAIRGSWASMNDHLCAGDADESTVLLVIFAEVWYPHGGFFPGASGLGVCRGSGGVALMPVPASPI